MNGKRDCKNCIHKVPVFDEEEGIWRGADCDSWDCRFVSRADALKAYEDRPQGVWKEPHFDGWYTQATCSICGVRNIWDNYCPNCGADMRKGGKE